MNKKLSTFDLNLASALVTLGFDLVKLDKTNPKKVRFVFRDTGNAQKTMHQYWNGELKLPAQKLLNNQKMLKNRIYSDA